jgi:hypothetical protein
MCALKRGRNGSEGGLLHVRLAERSTTAWQGAPRESPVPHGLLIYALLSTWASDEIVSDAARSAIRKLAEAGPPLVYRRMRRMPVMRWGAQLERAGYDYVWADARLSEAEFEQLVRVAGQITSVGGAPFDLAIAASFSPEAGHFLVTESVKRPGRPTRNPQHRHWTAYLCEAERLSAVHTAIAVGALRLQLRLLRMRPSTPNPGESAATVVPLPFIGYPGADGSLLGFAICSTTYPASTARDSLTVANCEASTMAEFGDLVRLEVPHQGLMLLHRTPLARLSHPCVRPEMWTRASCAWTTATPVVIDRAAASVSCCEHVREECEDRGWHVTRVAVTEPTCPGVRAASDYTGPAADRFQSRHVLLELAQPVPGPLLLGVGAELGLGLMLPLDGAPNWPHRARTSV